MKLRGVCAALLAFAAGLCIAGSAEASAKVRTNTVNYKIKGTTGEALLDAMDRKGPRHGFTTRAIAQTGYTVTWTMDTRERDGGCRIVQADAVLDVTFNYPQVAGPMSAALSRRWHSFMTGVRRHEQTHARIASEMVDAAQRQVKSVSFARDRGCARTQAEAKRRISAIYAKYEARQVEFDRVEHSPGGNVERLVTRLADGG
jgi:predicted secreted Zn-dependent protease